MSSNVAAADGRTWSRVGGVCAMVGGLCWAVKALAILVTGDQPPILFEIAPVFFAAGLIGLYAKLPARRGPAARIGIALATISGALAVLGLYPTGSSADE